MQNVTKHTRAPRGGRMIECPHCHWPTRVYHFAWYAMVCEGCGKAVRKLAWRKA
jgi:ribosomal protein S27E